MRNGRELATISGPAMKILKLMPIMLCVGLALALKSSAEEATQAASAQTVIKKKDGLRFNVPSDWPVEERNGAVGPIPIEEYLAKKFASLESRLRVLEQQVNSYDLRLRVLEESKKSSRPGGTLRSGERESAAPQ